MQAALIRRLAPPSALGASSKSVRPLSSAMLQQRPGRQLPPRCVARRALDPVLRDWLSSYGVHSKAVLGVLDNFGAHTRDDLQYLSKEEMEGLHKAKGVSPVQLGRLRAAIKGDADVRRWKTLTGATVGGSEAAGLHERQIWALPTAPAAPSLATAVCAAAAAAAIDAAATAPASAEASVTEAAGSAAASAPEAPERAPAEAVWFDKSVGGTLLRTIPVATTGLHPVAFSPCSSYVAMGLGDGGVKIWNVHTGGEEACMTRAELEELNSGGDSNSDDEECAEENAADGTRKITSVSWNADGRSLLVSTLNVNEGCDLHLLRVPDRLVPGVTSQDDGRLVKMTPPLPGPFCDTFDPDVDRLTHAAFGADGRTIVAVTAGNAALHVWDCVRGRWAATSCTMLSASGNFPRKRWGTDNWQVALSQRPDPAHPERSQLLAAVGGRGGVRVWDIGVPNLNDDTWDEEPMAQEEEGSKKVVSMSMSADGAVLAAGCNDGTVSVYDMTQIQRHHTQEEEEEARLDALRPTRVICCPASPLLSTALTPCGKGVISSSLIGTTVSEVASGALVTEMLASGWEAGVAVSPNGKLAAVASRGLSLWRLKP